MLDGLDSFSSTSEKDLIVQFSGQIASNFLRLTIIKYRREKINVSGNKLPRPLGQMLTSSRLNRTTQVDVVKTGLGAFHTKGSCWLNSVVSEFIVSTNLRRAVDPFAGNGDMLDLVGSKFSMQKSGYDIDDSTVWEVNDSLVSIPRSPGSICITNPPFLAKYSARRKSLWPMVGRYYERYGRNDLYEIALDRCLASFGHVVAILPETFLHSAYSKDRCERIIVLEENPFNDTTFPVCVTCWSPATDQDPDIYVGEDKVTRYSDITRLRKSVGRSNRIVFNHSEGNIGLRAVDGNKEGDRIAFFHGDEFDYPRSRIKSSSRLMTYIMVGELDSEEAIQEFCETSNGILESYRERTSDTILSGFKGNNRLGKRRRGLDYGLARKVVIEALGATTNARA